MAEQTQLNYIPGHSRPRGWRELRFTDIALAAGALALVVVFCWRSMEMTQHAWDWSRLWGYVVSVDAKGEAQAGMLLIGLFSTLRECRIRGLLLRLTPIKRQIFLNMQIMV